MTLRNWGGTYRYQAPEISTPRSLAELASILRGSDHVRVVGTRHSFSGIADAATMVSLAGLDTRFEIDRTAMTVTVDGAITYGRLAEMLAPHGLALQNLASLAHLSVAGAVAAGTHGSGDTNGNLATAVVGLEIMTANGDLVALNSGEAGFDGAVVACGALGVVTALTLRVEPAYKMQQHVFVDIGLGDLVEDFDGVFASGYSVSAFTRWDGRVEQVWVKDRVGEARTLSPVLARAAVATSQCHPVPDMDPSVCTQQLGVAGRWDERLPHFRFDATPSAGAEIQSEYFVPRSTAAAAIAAIQAIGPRLRPGLMICEMRTIAADQLWLSQCFGRDTLAFHFTWHPDARAAGAAAAALEAALAAFEVRPHWAKLFTPGFSATCDYPRRADAMELIASFDPLGRFANDWARAEGLARR